MTNKRDIRVAIVDDEVHCIESLVIHLNDLFPEFHLAYKTNNVQQAVRKLNELEIDLLFLDIEMPGMNGFQLLENFPKRKFDVILPQLTVNMPFRHLRPRPLVIC